MKKVLIVVGTRPNFIKITQFQRCFDAYPGQFDYRLVHTGQHYDYNMADVFFQQLRIRQPDYFLNISEGSPVAKVAGIIAAMEPILDAFKPDMVVVVGDVDSTFAAGFAAYKKGCLVAHLESGLRSFDREMPEEINRLLTDELAQVFFVTEASGITNLEREGKQQNQMYLVGNTMIDTLVAFEHDIEASDIIERLQLQPDNFALVTMHRPSNVDNEANFKLIYEVLKMLTAKGVPVVFPIHPRSLKKAAAFGILEALQKLPNCTLCEPLDYLAFQKLIKQSAFVLTDSGGIQEETTYRGVPCLTLRKNTERPCTLTEGTNELLDFDVQAIAKVVDAILAGTFKKGRIPALWDGHATERIVTIIQNLLEHKPANPS